jgi:hypothetical protein
MYIIYVTRTWEVKKVKTTVGNAPHLLAAVAAAVETAVAAVAVAVAAVVAAVVVVVAAAVAAVAYATIGYSWYLDTTNLFYQHRDAVGDKAIARVNLVNDLLCSCILLLRGYMVGDVFLDAVKQEEDVAVVVGVVVAVVGKDVYMTLGE